MTVPQIGFLIAQGLVFAVWAYTIFRTLFGLLGRGQVRTGRPFPGLRTFGIVAKDWMADPDHRRDRWLIGGLTALLILLSAISPFIL